MTDPDLDHRLLDDENYFLYYNSPFFEFGFDERETMNEYVNRIMQPIATDTEFCLGIYNWQHRLYPHVPMLKNFVGLQNLALPSHKAEIS